MNVRTDNPARFVALAAFVGFAVVCCRFGFAVARIGSPLHASPACVPPLCVACRSLLLLPSSAAPSSAVASASSSLSSVIAVPRFARVRAAAICAVCRSWARCSLCVLRLCAVVASASPSFSSAVVAARLALACHRVSRRCASSPRAPATAVALWACAWRGLSFLTLRHLLTLPCRGQGSRGFRCAFRVRPDRPVVSSARPILRRRVLDAVVGCVCARLARTYSEWVRFARLWLSCLFRLVQCHLVV